MLWFFILTFAIGNLGLEILEHDYVLSEEGASTTLECKFGMDVEFCTFFRPDQSEICQGDNFNTDLISKNCIKDNSVDIQASGPKCILHLENVRTEHFGKWKCKAMSWDEWAETDVKLKRFKSGSVSIDIWGTANFYSSVEQELHCELELDEPLVEEFNGQKLIWSINGMNEERDLTDRTVTVDYEDDGRFVSTLVYSPSTMDDKKNLSCYSPLTGQRDLVELNVFLFRPPNNIFDTEITAVEGESAEFLINFEAYPRVTADQVVLEIKDENGNQFELSPGDSSGEFSLSDIEYEWSNRHSLKLFIQEIKKEHVEFSMNLVIKFDEKKENKHEIPLKIVQVEEPPTTTTEEPTRRPAILPESPALEERVPTTTNISTTEKDIEEQSFGLFIVLGIVALCLVLCCLYYCTCCGRKKKVKKVADPETAPMISDEQKKEDTLAEVQILSEKNGEENTATEVLVPTANDSDHEAIRSKNQQLQDLLEVNKAEYDAMKSEKDEEASDNSNHTTEESVHSSQENNNDDLSSGAANKEKTVIIEESKVVTATSVIKVEEKILTTSTANEVKDNKAIKNELHISEEDLSPQKEEVTPPAWSEDQLIDENGNKCHTDSRTQLDNLLHSLDIETEKNTVDEPDVSVVQTKKDDSDRKSNSSSLQEEIEKIEKEADKKAESELDKNSMHVSRNNSKQENDNENSPVSTGGVLISVNINTITLMKSAS